MAKSAFYDYSTTPTSNTDIDGLDATGATGLVKSGDNYSRSMMSHAKGFALDLGAVNTVGGTGDAITVTLASAPTALVDGMRFVFSASAINTGATTLNVTPAGGSAFGAKKVRKWVAGVETALSAGDIAGAGSLVEVIYDTDRDTAAGAWMLANPSAAPTFATNAQAVIGTSTVLAVNPANLAFVTDGYATTATAAGTTTLTTESAPQQFFTGSTSQTLVLPVTSTLNLGRTFRVVNNSTGAVTVQSSGANTIIVLATGASADVTCILTSGTTAASWDYRLASSGPHVIIEDQKASGSSGGTFTSGADQTRVLNTEVYDPQNIVSLSSNQFTLQAGSYYIRWEAPAYRVGVHQSLLYNVTDAAEVKRGTSNYTASGGDYPQNTSVGSAVASIAGAKAFEIRHRCSATRSPEGFGNGASFGTEVFTRVEITKVA